MSNLHGVSEAAVEIDQTVKTLFTGLNSLPKEEQHLSEGRAGQRNVHVLMGRPSEQEGGVQ